MIAKSALALSAAVLLFPAMTDAAECGSPSLNGVSLQVDEYRLIAEKSGQPLNELELPVVGSAWRCLAMHAYPRHRLFFMEWDAGTAGTSQMFNRASLLAFIVDDGGIRPYGEWVLRQRYDGAGPSIIEADRTYRLEEHPDGVDVVLEGLQRILLDSQ